METSKQKTPRANDNVPIERTRPTDTKSRTPNQGTQVKLPRLPTWLGFLLVLLANYYLFILLFPGPEAPVTVPYTLFKQQVEKGNVHSIFSQGNVIKGRFKTPVMYSPDSGTSTQHDARKAVSSFSTTIPYFVDPGLETLLIDHGVEISAKPIQEERSPLATLFYSFGPGLLLIGFYMWYFQKAAKQGEGFGGMLGIGKSKARRYDQQAGAKVTFNDVAGIEEAENELVEIVDFLKDPARYSRLGGTAPKGVLLIGAPGTGKTLLAKAVAGEAGVPFFSMSASEFVEMIVGVGAARVRDLFKQARESAPSIIFIDELDAIGRARGQVGIGGIGEQEQTLNQILTEMDGFSGREGIIVLAATNQPEVLDKALLRPGRFDRRVTVNLPDKAGREAILKVHTRNVPLAKDANLEEIAAITPGFSGADIRNLVNEAALLAARRRQDQVHGKDFLDSLEKIVLGPERPLLLSRADKERIAYHESGHAILGLVVPGADPVQRVTIVPRGQALGVTYQRPDSDRYNYPESYLRARIVGMLGGRAAEELVYGTKTTGAESDIEQATNLARQMVTRWGMSEALGLVQLAPRENPYLRGAGGFYDTKPFSEETAKTIDAEVLKIIRESHNEAKQLLVTYRKQLDALAGALMERESLDEQEILKATGLHRPLPPLMNMGLHGSSSINEDGMSSVHSEKKQSQGVKSLSELSLPLILSIMLSFLAPAVTVYSQERSLQNELNNFLIASMKFSEQECEKVFQGQLVVKTVDSGHKAEVLAIGIGHVEAPRSFFIEHYGKEIKPLETQALVQSKLFSRPPQVSDLENYTLADKDLEALKNCKSGDCDIKISEDMIKRFRQEIDWEAPDYAEKANRLFREMLAQYMASYLRAGNAAMMAYGDQKYTLNMVSEFQALLASSPYLNVNPQFYSYLKNFPSATLPNVKDFFFWMQEDLGLKHSVVSLNHLSFYQPAETEKVALLVNKQLYANHYFEASLGITGFVDEAGVDNRGFYLISIPRFRIDALRRGGLEGSTIRKKLQSSIPPLLNKRMSSIIDAAEKLYQQQKPVQ